jgi:23S rRNA U2552 (ribose-2'-O)-methylase RlmE/FtsJ
MNIHRIANDAVRHHAAVQKVLELEALLWVLQGRKLETIVEIGCYRGGTLYAWQFFAKNVYGIDLQMDFNHHGATVIVGDSHLEPTKQKLVSLLPNGCDMLFLDGDHSEAGVRLDVEMYLPLIRNGGLLVMHDITDAESHRGSAIVWRELDGKKQEFICPPRLEGGIGIMEVNHASQHIPIMQGIQ